MVYGLDTQSPPSFVISQFPIPFSKSSKNGMDGSCSVVKDQVGPKVVQFPSEPLIFQEYVVE